MLIPFVDMDGLHDKPWWKQYDIYSAYLQNAAQYFEYVDSLEEADFAVLPNRYIDYLRYDQEATAHAFAEKAAQSQKYVLVFNDHDYDVKLPAKNTIQFNPAIERRDPAYIQFGQPPWVPDHLTGHDIEIRPKQDNPHVGFCGRVIKPTVRNRMVRFARLYVPGLRAVPIGHISSQRMVVKELYQHRFIRYEILRHLEQDARVQTNFITSSFFLEVQQGKEWKQEAVEKATNRYVDNMVNNDYNIAARGTGNYSFRFYETLLCARLPIFVNTNCVLPFDFEINWRDELLWMEAEDVKQVAQRLVEYHEAMTPDEFEERQRRNRWLWEEWLSPNGFFKNFYRHMDHIKF